MHVSVGASRPKTAVIGSCLSHIELQMILLAPHDKGVNHWLHHPQGCIQPPQRHQKTSEDGGLCVGAEVCGADGEEERVRGWYLCC